MTMPLTFKTPKPVGLLAPLKVLLRPIFFVAIGLHAALLFMPLPQEEKPRVADDKKDPVKVTQVPTAGLTKPLPTVAPGGKANTPGKPAIATTTVSKTPAIAATATAAAGTAATSTPLPTVQAGSTTTLPATDTTAPPPGSSASPNPTVASTSTVNPEEALFKTLASIPTPDASDPASTNVPGHELFGEPAKFFMTAKDAEGELEWRPELKGSPVLAMGDTPEYFYETLFQGELKPIFAEMKKVGEYGGGPLYHLKQGSFEVYVNLVPVKMPPATTGLGTIIAVWSKDPRTL